MKFQFSKFTESISTIENSSDVKDPALTKAFLGDVGGDISEDIGEVHTIVEDERKHHQQLLGSDKELQGFRERSGL